MIYTQSNTLLLHLWHLLFRELVKHPIHMAPQHHVPLLLSPHVSPRAAIPWASLSWALCSASGLKRSFLEVSKEALNQYFKNYREFCFKMYYRSGHREVSKNRSTTHLAGIFQQRSTQSISAKCILHMYFMYTRDGHCFARTHSKAVLLEAAQWRTGQEKWQGVNTMCPSPLTFHMSRTESVKELIALDSHPEDACPKPQMALTFFKLGSQISVVSNSAIIATCPSHLNLWTTLPPLSNFILN